MAAEPIANDWLALDDEHLLGQCEVHHYRSSGPGGQHRNKVSSAVRLKHRPTGVTAHSAESRSQRDNKRTALRRLRSHLACRRRRRVDPAEPLPSVVAECLFSPRGTPPLPRKRLQVGRKDRRFWSVAAFLLDLLDTCQGRLADSAGLLGISTGQLAAFLKSDRHLLAAAQQIRKAHAQKPLA